MPKGGVQGGDAATQMVQLRDLIREYEIGAANLKGRGVAALDLLKLRDSIEDEAARLQADGVDLRPELTRVETSDNVLERKTSTLVHELRSVGGLAGARQERRPPQERWWWYVDIALAERQRKQATRFVLIVGAALIVVFGADYLLNRFYGMSPVEKEARQYTISAEQHMRDQDIDGAIAEYQQAVATLPSLGEAHVALAVLYDKKGMAKESAEAFRAAEETFSRREDYFVAVSRAYEALGSMDEALRYAQQAVDVAPDSAQAYLIRGGVYESLNKVTEANADYLKAGELAQEHGENTLYVLARTRLGMLLQRGSGMGGAGFGQ